MQRLVGAGQVAHYEAAPKLAQHMELQFFRQLGEFRGTRRIKNDLERLHFRALLGLSLLSSRIVSLLIQSLGSR